MKFYNVIEFHFKILGFKSIFQLELENSFKSIIFNPFLFKFKIMKTFMVTELPKALVKI